MLQYIPGKYNIRTMAASTIRYIVLLFVASLVSDACPNISGSFFIDQKDLYPESADFDPKTCKLYVRYVALEKKKIQKRRNSTEQP